MKGCILGQMDWYFVLLSYIGPALDRTMVQSSNLVCLESDVGAIKWVWFCICMSVLFVSKRMERKLYLYETPMYFNYFVYFV